MKNFKLIVLAVLLIGAVKIGGEVSASPPTQSSPVVEVNESTIRLQWEVGQPEFVPQADGSVLIFIDGFENLQTPGAAQLPYNSVLIALPEDAKPTLNLSIRRQENLNSGNPLAIAPEPRSLLPNENLPEDLASRWRSPSQNASFTPNLVEIEELGIVRGVRIARVTFYPIRPVGNHLNFVKDIDVTVNLNATVNRESGSASENDVLIDTLKTQVINPMHVQPAFETSNTGGVSTRAAAAAAEIAIVEVSERGITEITYGDLNAAGFPVDTVNPNNVKLTHQGVEVKMMWEGNGDSTFESDERFLFYADPVFSRWSTHDTYHLEETGGVVGRMATRDANPAGLPAGKAEAQAFFEQNKIYYSSGVVPNGRDGDRFAWDVLQIPSDTLITFDANILTVDNSQTATLDIWLIGITDIPFVALDHRVAAQMNSESLGNIEWDGQQVVHGTLPIPASNLHVGINNLQLSLPGITGVPIEAAYVDAFAITYILGNETVGERQLFTGEAVQSAYNITLLNGIGIKGFDVSDPNNPILLTNLGISSYTVTIGDPSGTAEYDYFVTTESGVHTPATIRLSQPLASEAQGFLGADYLIITHGDFAASLSGIIALRESKGLSVHLEDVQAIYDQLNHGRLDPESIKNYISNAYHNWPTRPLYMLLVGDGTYDPRKVLWSSTDTYIPPYLANVDPWLGETASDNQYVTVDGTDNLPDLLIGRFPSNSLAELNAMVNKTIAYEALDTSASWLLDAVFIADDEDSGGHFADDSDEVINDALPNEYNPQQIYHPVGATPEQIDQTKAAVLNAWNTGAGFMTYFGHSSSHQWAAERFIHKDDAPALTNQNKLPILLQMTCLSARFHEAGGSVLDESLLIQLDTGAIGVWGPTGFGLATGHVYLAEGFFDSLLNSSDTTVGQASLAGKLNLAATTSSFSDLIDTFTYLGDPALNYLGGGATGGTQIYLPLIQR